MKEVFKEVRSLSTPGSVVVGSIHVTERPHPKKSGEEQTVLTCLVDGTPRHTKVLGPHSSKKLLIANAKKRTRRMLRKVVQVDRENYENVS